MTNSVHIVLEGKPVGKARPRFTRQGRAYTPAKTKDYEMQLRSKATLEMADREPTETPCRVKILAQFETPKSWPKYKQREAITGESNWRPGKPDIDNIAKAVLDAFNGVVFKDDALVYKIEVEKRYGMQPLLIASVFFDE